METCTAINRMTVRILSGYQTVIDLLPLACSVLFMDGIIIDDGSYASVREEELLFPFVTLFREFVTDAGIFYLKRLAVEDRGDRFIHFLLDHFRGKDEVFLPGKDVFFGTVFIGGIGYLFSLDKRDRSTLLGSRFGQSEDQGEGQEHGKKTHWE